MATVLYVLAAVVLVASLAMGIFWGVMISLVIAVFAQEYRELKR